MSEHRAAVLLGWNYGGSLALAACQFVIGMIFARLLGPDDFGIMALALMLAMLAAQISDAGLGTLLTIDPEFNERQISTVVVRQMVLALMFATLLFFFAPRLSQFFGLQRGTDVLTATSGLILALVAGRAPTAVLRRRLAFRQLQLVQLGAYIIAYGVIGLGMALAGYGIWSLFTAAITQSSVVAIAAWKLGNFPFSRPSSCLSSRQERYAATSFGANVFSTIFGHWEVFVICNILGTIPLGLYNRTQAITTIAAMGVASPAQSVLQTWLRRFRDQPRQVQEVLHTTLAVSWLAMLPAAIIAIADPTAVIVAILGQQWLGCVPLLTPMVMAAVAYPLMAIQLSALNSIGNARADMWTQLVSAVTAIPFLLWATHQGLSTTAWCILGLGLLRTGLVSISSARNSILGVSGLLRLLMPASLFPVVAAFFGIILAAFTAPEHVRPFAACGLAYLLLTAIIWLRPGLVLPPVAASWMRRMPNTSPS